MLIKSPIFFVIIGFTNTLSFKCTSHSIDYQNTVSFGGMDGNFRPELVASLGQNLQAYRFLGETFELILIGPHENYYKD